MADHRAATEQADKPAVTSQDAALPGARLSRLGRRAKNKDGSGNGRKPAKQTWAGALSRDWRLYSLLVLPTLYFIIFRYLPMAGNVIAFRKFQPGGSIFGEYWVGFQYVEMFIHDPTFWNVFKNTITLGVLTLVFSFPMPIIFALLLNELRSKKFKKIVQSISYLPHFMSVVIVVGMIFQLTSLKGTINQLIGHFSGGAINFMQQAAWFRPAGRRAWASAGRSWPRATPSGTATPTTSPCHGADAGMSRVTARRWVTASTSSTCCLLCSARGPRSPR